jgi:hypothetical protein
MTIFWDVAPCSLVEIYQLLERHTASIIREMVMAVSTSEMSVNFYQTTRRNIPEDSHLHTHRRENLKSNVFIIVFSACVVAIDIYRRESFPVWRWQVSLYHCLGP